MTNIDPLGSLILVEKIEQAERKTSSGLVLSAAVLDTELARGKVISVGPGDYDNVGNKHDIPLTNGDVVIYNENNATEVTDASGSKYYFINWRSLFGKESSL
jgi:co-chaperonin GroES (HSP10)